MLSTFGLIYMHTCMSFQFKGSIQVKALAARLIRNYVMTVINLTFTKPAVRYRLFTDNGIRRKI